jgi:DNA-binding phage protein
MEGERQDLREALAVKGMTASEVAANAKISTASVYRAFNGQASPHVVRCIEYVLQPVVRMVEQ